MLCIVLIVVILVMYISQRSFRKRGVAVYQQHRGWLEAEGVLDVYTVDRVRYVLFARNVAPEL